MIGTFKYLVAIIEVHGMLQLSRVINVRHYMQSDTLKSHPVERKWSLYENCETWLRDG